MRSGAPGGSWGYVRRPAWRRSGRVERGRAGAGGCRSSRFEVVELHRSSSGRCGQGVSPSLPPAWSRLLVPVKGCGLPVELPGACVIG